MVAGSVWYDNVFGGGAAAPGGMDVDTGLADPGTGDGEVDEAAAQLVRDEIKSARGLAQHHRDQVKQLGLVGASGIFGPPLAAEIARHAAQAEDYERAVQERVVFQRGEQPHEVQLAKKLALVKVFEGNIAKAGADHEGLLAKLRAVGEEADAKADYLASQESKLAVPRG